MKLKLKVYCALLCAPCVVSCSGSNAASADTNEDGYISSAEAEAALQMIEQIEIQPGQWEFTEVSTRGTPGSERTSSGCLAADEIRDAVRGIAFLSAEEEIRATPSSSCQFRTLEIDSSDVAIDIVCEIEFSDSAKATSTQTLRSHFTPTSFESSMFYESDDYMQFGLDEGDVWTESGSVSGTRTGGC